MKVPTAFTTRFNNNEKSVSTMNHHLQTKILIKMEVVDSSNHVPVKRKTKRLRRPKKRNGLVKRKPNEMLAQATTIFLEWKDLFDPQTIRKKKTLSKGNMRENHWTSNSKNLPCLHRSNPINLNFSQNWHHGRKCPRATLTMATSHQA